MKYTVHHFDKLDSTNNEAARLAEEGASEGTVVIAEEQMSGRGRRGRNWSSPPGSGLYTSIILRPEKPFEELWQIGFVAALATVAAVTKASGLSARIKWPNDVLINGRKVCGILIEAKHTSTPHQAVIVGIGVNVNTPAFPEELKDKATSIFLETGNSLNISDMEQALLDSLDARYTQYLEEGFPAILEAWKEFDCTAGRQVSVVTSEGTVSGTAEGVDSSGDLIVRQEDGSTAKLSSGEVILSR